jgi:hypothetical protein
MRDWLCDGESFLDEIQSAKDQRAPLTSLSERLTLWWQADRFRVSVGRADRCIEHLAASLPDRGSQGVLDACTHGGTSGDEDTPSLVVLAGALQGLDSGILTTWGKWCDQQILPAPAAKLLTRAALPAGTANSPDFTRFTAFRAHQDWSLLQERFSAFPRQFLADESAQLDGLMAEDRLNEIEGCLQVIRTCERLLCLGVVDGKPWEVLRLSREALCEILTKQLPRLPTERFADHESLFRFAELRGLSVRRVINDCPGKSGQAGRDYLTQRENDRKTDRLAFAEARFAELGTVERRLGGQVSFEFFQEGVAALAEAKALGAAIPKDVGENCLAWWDNYRKLEHLRHVAEEGAKHAQLLKQQARTLRKDSSADLEKRLVEIRKSGEQQRTLFHSAPGNLLLHDNKSKADFGENSFLPSKKIIDSEIRRRRAARIRNVAAVTSLVVLSWIGIDTYFRASGEADQRIGDLAALRKNASVELVQEALTSAQEPQWVDGLFRLFPKWKNEVLITDNWVAEQLALTKRLTELQVELKDFHLIMEPYSGADKAEVWTRNLQGWSATEGTFAEARNVVSAMAAGVALPEKADFQRLDQAWTGELTQRAKSFSEDLTIAIDTAAAFFTTRPPGADLPGLEEMQEKLKTLLPPLVRGGEAAREASEISPALPPLRDEVARIQDDLQQQQAATETAGAELLRLSSALNELGKATGLPTFAKKINDLPSTPGSIEKLLPRTLESDIATVKKALSDATRFEELVFDDFASLGKLTSDPPVLESPSEELKQIMIDLLDDWRLKDIYAWQERTGGRINAYSRDKPTRGTSDSGSVTWSLEAYLLDDGEEASRLASFQEYTAIDTSGGRAASLTGKFPRGKPVLSDESLFFLDLDLHLMFDAAAGTFKNSILGVLDKLIAEANRSESNANLVMIAFLHRELGRVVSQNPRAWGADLTSFSRDYAALTSLQTEGVTLNLSADDWMVPDVAQRWSSTLEVYYLSLTDRSYQREYRDSVSVVSSFAGGVGFEYVGYLDVMGKPQLLVTLPKAGKILWGIKEDIKTEQILAAPACQIAEDGTLEMLSRTASLCPLFSGSEEFDRFFDQITRDGKLSWILKYQ